MARDGNVQLGAKRTIGVLQRSDGRKIDLVVAEGTFKQSSIEPVSQWSNILSKPSMLVSSADEHLRNDGGISRAIGSGCSIAQVQSPLPTGKVNIDVCAGDYKAKFPKLEFVASAVIVAWKGVSEKPNCRFDDLSLQPYQPGFAKCFQTAIESALSSLFKSDDIARIDTLVLPALGTGTGRLSKGESYNSTINSLLACLQVAKCANNLPSSIVFLVWSGEANPGAWTETRDAVARNVATLAADWSGQYTSTLPIQKQARFVGILIVILVAVFAYSIQQHLPESISKRFPVLNAGSLWLLVFGWFFVAAGAFSVLVDFVDVPVVANAPHAQRDVALNIAFGILAGISCGLIHKATKLFQGT